MNKYDYKDPDTFTEEDYFYQDNDDVLWGKPDVDPVYEFLNSVANFHYKEGDNYFEMMQLIGRAKDLLRKEYGR